MEHVKFSDILYFIAYLGTGENFRDHRMWAFLLNLPFVIGFAAGVFRSYRKTPQLILAAIFIISLGIILIQSTIGQSLLFERYMLFLLPPYLAMVISGWREISQIRWRRLGLAGMFGVLVLAQVYYNLFFIQVNDQFRYHGLHHSDRRDNGRATSQAAAMIRERLKPNEVLIHYSEEVIRSLSFFSSIYYNHRSLPEYIYSVKQLPAHCGRQYLQPGERLARLSTLNPLPEGIWVVTWGPVDFLGYNTPLVKQNRARSNLWVEKEDLPKELYNAGYRPDEAFNVTGISVVHFRRVSPTDSLYATGGLDLSALEFSAMHKKK
jgi:hypothetical protein